MKRSALLVAALAVSVAAAFAVGVARAATPPPPPMYTPLYVSITDTTQNHPNSPGVYHFWLARAFDTGKHPNGDYLLEVEASDVRGNPNTGRLAVTFANV